MTTEAGRALADRFWRSVRKSKKCWLWMGTRSKWGYGVVWVDGHHRQAHRVAWQLVGNPLNPDLTLDHLCRNRACVRPDHLEQVTNRVNVLRGETLPAANVAKTHCPKGHPYEGANLVIGKRGDRECRECHLAWNRAYYQRRRLALLDAP